MPHLVLWHWPFSWSEVQDKKSLVRQLLALVTRVVRPASLWISGTEHVDIIKYKPETNLS